jgi:hypothetical protein
MGVGRIVNPDRTMPMQFLVERMCPHAPEAAAESLAKLGIHIVWVTDTDAHHKYGCTRRCWRVTEEDRIIATRKLGQQSTGGLVCEDMGHLIE